MSTGAPTSRLHAIFVCCFAAAAGIARAALVPAPPAVLPLICAICACYPLAFGDELRSSIAFLRGRRDLLRLRQELDRLPETEHPLEP